VRREGRAVSTHVTDDAASVRPAPAAGADPAIAVRVTTWLVGIYVVAVVFNLGRESEPLLSIQDPAGDDIPGWVVQRVTFWVAVVAVPLAVLLWLLSRTRAGRGGWLRWAPPAVALLPFVLPTLDAVAHNVLWALACVPTTTFALWVLARSQPFSRVPAAPLLAAFAWGLLPAVGLAMTATILTQGTVTTWAIDVRWPQYPGATEILDIRHDVGHAMAWYVGVVEEVVKGAGILLVVRYAGRHVHDAVSGLAVGAAVGLGFNLGETVLYTAQGGDAAFQFYARQGLGLFVAHTAFSGLVGAAIGFARRLPDPRDRQRVAVAALTAAALTHVAADTLPGWLPHVFGLSDAGPLLRTLVLVPLWIVLVQGALLACLWRVRRAGLRRQAAALSAELPAEAATGRGAVTDEDVPILLDPAARTWLALTTLRRHGWASFLALRRVQAAQLELGIARWRPVDGGPGADDAVLETVRERVLRLRAGDRPAAGPEAPA
jgi:RsiW-degrading membrane proteinase PrsW (M82 family)